MGMDPMGGMMGGEELNPVMQFYLSLPEWGQALTRTLLVILAAALIGKILGSLYASIRYPDPEKTGALSPRMRALFLVVLVLCGVWLYRTITKKEEPGEPVMGEEFSSAAPEDEYAPEVGGTYSNVGGAVAVAIPG